MTVSLIYSYRLGEGVILYKVTLLIGYLAIAITTPIIYIDYTNGLYSYIFRVTYIVRFIFIFFYSLCAHFFIKNT